jgi:EAL domain-containing protein (putative c-di-GMP-specific phosphodiesterase class I)
MVGQPIVRLDDRNKVGIEALARFSGPPDLGPAEVFRQAALDGDGCRLEAMAIRLAMKALPYLPENEFLAVNASPEGCVSKAVQALLANDSDRIVLEITERSQIDSYLFLNRALLRLRADGMRIAVDDVGSGFANWGHIVHLQPDIIKLDGLLITDIEADNLRRAVVKGVVRMAVDLGSNVVAEQVETVAQADALTDLGVEWAQGYYFAHPAPLRN